MTGIVTLVWVTFFLFFANFSNSQYQQFTHIKGSSYVESIEQYGETGVYNEKNSIGGIYLSKSFLLKEESEILVFYGKRTDLNDNTKKTFTDQIWKFSVNNREWMFLKGRKDVNSYSIFSQENVFHIDNQIGSRISNGWKNEDFIHIFGGLGYLKSGPKGFINDFWTYSITNNSYSVFFYPDSDCYANYQNLGEFDTNNIPGGRSNHEIIKLNEEEILLLGGYGFGTSSSFILPDWWIFSTEKMQWCYLGGNIDTTTQSDMIYGKTNVYSPTNTMGSKMGFSGLKINEEEILIFGGEGKTGGIFFNTIQKYNVSSNQWKYVSGNSTFKYGQGCFREYTKENMIGQRAYHKIWKINEDEILVFGGRGFNYNSAISDSFYLNDEWRFNTKTNLWRFTGKESTKYREYAYQESGEKEIFSESTLYGGVQAYIGEFIEENNEIIICNGDGYGKYESGGTIDDCFRLFLGNVCNLLDEFDPAVCSYNGTCVAHDMCDCRIGYGDFCELSKCFDILSNKTNVCANNGVCKDGKCYCNTDNAFFLKQDCSDNIELIAFMNNLWIYISVPIAAILVFFLIIILVIGAIILFYKLRTTQKKFEGIEDVELILEEAKLEQNSNQAHFKINKALFEIDPKDITIEKKIGSGGSSAVVYSGIWNKQVVAYKCFVVREFLETEKYTEFEREVEILASISFPFILKFYGATLTRNRLGFVMEFAENGDLSCFLKEYPEKKGKNYPMQEKLRMLSEISSSMLFLHNKKIIHRDLKPQNVLVTKREETRLMDFGLSKIVEDDTTKTKKIGTSIFIAPEVIEGKYSFPCDVYSFAIMMFIVLTEDFYPFGKHVSHSISSQIALNPSKRPNLKTLNDVKELKNREVVKDMLKQNWDKNASNRMDFGQITDFLDRQRKEYEKEEKKKLKK